jgi:SMI1 / KNR4 family (SUKH-1)
LIGSVTQGALAGAIDPGLWSGTASRFGQMLELGSALKCLIDRWRNEDIPIRPGVTQDAVAKFEARWKVVLPSDLREYFLTVDGTGDHYEEAFFRFWPLEEVQPVQDYSSELYRLLPQSAGYFVFCDHSIDLFVYAIQMSNANDDANPLADLSTTFATAF